MAVSQLVSSLAQELGNRLLRLDPDSLERLGRFEGKVVCFRFTPFDQPLYLEPSTAGVRLHDQWAGEPSVTLSGSPVAFAAYLGGDKDPDTLSKTGISSEGDDELAWAFMSVLAGLDIDWEEVVAPYLGDVVAHRLGNLVRATHAWAREAVDVLVRDVGEYLQEETEQLAGVSRVNAFRMAVDDLASDLAVLEDRVRQLGERAT